MNILEKLFPAIRRRSRSYIRDIATGSLYRVSDVRGESSFATIRTQIDTMRALAQDSQVSTALSFYATDATLTNTEGQVIWATPVDDGDSQAAEIVNTAFRRWNINAYVRDHILELATIGNLYIPTSRLFADQGDGLSYKSIGLDSNTIKDESFDIVPAYKLAPENVVHLWYQGQARGFIYQPEDDLSKRAKILLYPEESIIHFSLGGLLGDYNLDAYDEDGNDIRYDIQFAQPLMEMATQPTQTLSLLEDSLLLASLIRVVKFINVDVGTNVEEEEIRDILQDIKDQIEQQLALNTNTGDVESFVNPQSPNNLIYVPKVNGQDPISITDLNMAEATEQDSKLLDHFQNKKLSVLGVPKEAMNYSSNEGLGGAGSVLSQRSALYANALQRIKTAYIAGWTQAFNKYFIARGYSGLIDKFQLHMEPIITEQSTITFEKRDAAISQAQAIIDLMTTLGIDNAKTYKDALVEILTEVLPMTGSKIRDWHIHPEAGEGDDVSEF